MATHHLKTWPKYFNAIWSLEKNFEVRKNDRDFKVGDILILEEWEPEMERYTGCSEVRIVTYILSDPPFVPEGYVIMSLWARPTKGF